jgi:HlyD family secretion protein/epimerase transport system membrane fusion protein
MTKLTHRPSEPSYFRDPVLLLSIAFIFVGAGLFVFWAATAQLAQGITAQGTVIVENRRHAVQHLEGGMIQQIAIQEGGEVARGDVTMIISDANSVARLLQVRSERLGLLASLDRLNAHLADEESVTFPLLNAGAEAAMDVSNLVALNETLFLDQRAAQEGERSLVNAKIERLEAQTSVLTVRRAGKLREIVALNAEREIQDAALTQRLGNVSRVNELLRLLAVAETQLAEVDEEERVIAQSIAEAELERQQIGLRFRAELSSQLEDTTLDLARVNEELTALLDRQERSAVVAAVDGVVIDLEFTAPGGIVGPGARLFDIVPSNASQQIEVRFQPQDRDDLRTGRDVNLRFGTLDPINPPQLTGSLETIAPDATLDPQTNSFYYRAIVTIPESEYVALRDFEISPGIPVEVFFDKGAPRTPFSYFIEPIAEMLRLGMQS